MSYPQSQIALPSNQPSNPGRQRVFQGQASGGTQMRLLLLVCKFLAQTNHKGRLWRVKDGDGRNAPNFPLRHFQVDA
jgi:hypothetical protein